MRLLLKLSLIVIIFTPTLNNVSLVYIRPLNALKGFMICVNHSESLNELNTQVDVLLKKFDKLYCRDKKLLLHYYPLKALYGH